MPLVKDLMRGTDEIIHVDHDLQEALVRMRDLGVPFLPVVENDEILGILTAQDIYQDAQPVGAQKQTVRVRDHMSTDVSYCYDTDTLDIARKVMDESEHHRLLVVDSERQLVGTITLEAITAALRQHRPHQDRPHQPEAPSPKAEQRRVKTPGRAASGHWGGPRTFAVRPKIKKK